MLRVVYNRGTVYWASKLQTETALSTMESEIISLAHSCRELSPIIDITITLGQAVGMPIGDTTMDVSIHKYNSGALIWPRMFCHNLLHAANIIPPRTYGFVKR